MTEYFVIDWLKRYLDKPTLEEKELKPVLHYSLLWSLFESVYFTDDKSLNPKRLLDLSDISCDSLSDEKLFEIFNFFKKRYVSDDKINSKYNELKLSKKVLRDGLFSNFDYCQSILMGKSPTKPDTLKTVFLIVHRFRNNLFHGRKRTITLHIYKKPFNIINEFLIHFIEVTADNNTINNKRKIS